VTGLSLQTEELIGIWFELLKEALSSMTRVAILYHTRPGTSPKKDFEAAARSLGLEPLLLSVQTAADFQAAFQVASQRRAQALVLGASPLFGEHVGELAALALAHRLPTIAFESCFAAAGGLMNYGPRITDNYYRAATYIDRILNGTRPEELPIERPLRFYLAINLKTARALGLTIPSSLLLRADQVLQGTLEALPSPILRCMSGPRWVEGKSSE
jgi:putative ABC transport system substrate-binding protein